MLMMNSRESINRTPTAQAPKPTFVNLKESLNELVGASLHRRNDGLTVGKT